MNSILQDLYNGKIYPEEQGCPQTKEFRIMQKNLSDHQEAFLQKIGSPLDQELQEMIVEQLDVFSIEKTKSFIDGFRLGAKIVIEVFQDTSAL